ncbi:hypothetical protein, variant 2 [Cryptococcus amylolentus CBS 6039]|uniref:UBC core domain-containing protein n=1 Tax=Cryptococcus amylolentus CBS 6039 TaxID=1295533 RepID=A0A1E3I5E0_9TREE|nr:hypothetical protein, variant 1 [Cryptococcus amylolentus CBS 6039]XP_018997762.1 hypothetical protein, variant 2 [Cryptococcus amylolentus CBS 6039]ODN83761.1 hypothetical protein, variant 1 [Cryptococcus amylolentus CBS 6039]ODN83762.1 hypothetical protein, variant 2 [Cryptococcus amylolentus CBS 6039]
MQKHPVDGFSAGLVDDDNILEWGIVIMAPADTLWEGATLKTRLIFPPEYPLLPPKMIFDSEMWHPNVYDSGEKKGEEFVSILVSIRLSEKTLEWALLRVVRLVARVWRG